MSPKFEIPTMEEKKNIPTMQENNQNSLEFLQKKPVKKNEKKPVKKNQKKPTVKIN